jgi:hypothetical protein
MKIIFWTYEFLPQKKKYQVTFWSKPDKSNALKMFVAQVNYDTFIRKKIEDMTGLKTFELHRINPKL